MLLNGFLDVEPFPFALHATRARPRRPGPRAFFLVHPSSIGKNRGMTMKIAIGLALIFAAVFAVDAMAFGGTLPVVLGKKIFVFLDWLAFWR